MSEEQAIPVFPCASPEETLEFYQALGFEVTHRQVKPYVYLAVKRGGFDLHFVGGGKPDPEGGSATCLVMVDDVGPHHRAFAAALKASSAGCRPPGCPASRDCVRARADSRWSTRPATRSSSSPAMSRSTSIPTRSSGRSCRPWSGPWRRPPTSGTCGGRTLQAAKALDLALRKNPDAPPIERARVLAARVELAVAMGDEERARSAREELAAIDLTDEERERYRDEFQAAEALERMQG